MLEGKTMVLLGGWLLRLAGLSLVLASFRLGQRALDQGLDPMHLLWLGPAGAALGRQLPPEAHLVSGGLLAVSLLFVRGPWRGRRSEYFPAGPYFDCGNADGGNRVGRRHGLTGLVSRCHRA